MMIYLRSIMNIKWQDKVVTIKLLKRAGLHSMEDLILRKNLRRIGYLLSIPNDRLPCRFTTRSSTRTTFPSTALLQRHNQLKYKQKEYWYQLMEKAGTNVVMVRLLASKQNMVQSYWKRTRNLIDDMNTLANYTMTTGVKCQSLPHVQYHQSPIKKLSTP